MSDQEHKEEGHEEEILNEPILESVAEKKSWIDSFFLSTSAIVIIGFVFLINMFISGNYIFNINQEKIKIEKAKQWIESAKALEEKAKENQENIVQLELEILEKKGQVAGLKSRINSNKTIDEELNKEIVKKNQLISESNNLKFLIDNKTKNLESLLVKLKQENSDLNRELPQLKTKIENYRIESETNEKYLKEIKQTLGQKRKELAEVEGKVGSQNQVFLSTVSRIQEVEKIDSDFNKIKEEFRKITQNASKTVSDFNSTRELLNNSFNNLSSQIDDFKKSKDDMDYQLKESISGFKSDRNDMKNTVDNMESQVNTLESLNDKINTEVNTLANQNQTIRTSNENLRSISSNIESISRTLEDSEDEIDNLSRSMNRTGGALDDLNQDAKTLQSRLDMRAVNNLEKTLNELEKQLPELQRKIDLLKEN